MGYKASVGTISHGTLKTEDLIIALSDELRRRAMEQRHFWVVADTIKAQVEPLSGLQSPEPVAARAALKLTALEFARVFKASNANFKRDKFLTACGFAEEA